MVQVDAAAEQVGVPITKEFAAQISTIPFVDIVHIGPKAAVPEKATAVLAKVTPSPNLKIIPASNILEEVQSFQCFSFLKLKYLRLVSNPLLLPRK